MPAKANARDGTPDRTVNRGKGKRATAPSAPAVVEPETPPTKAEWADFHAWEARRKTRPPPPKVKHDGVEKDGRVVVGHDHPHTGIWIARLCNTFGTTDPMLAQRQMDQLLTATKSIGKHSVPDVNELNAAIAAVAGIAPRDEIEGMLAIQMVATHTAALRLMARMLQAETLPQVDSAGNMVAKLLRSYAAQTEALAKYRRRGAQTVRVEHVHVHPGAQAIVGNVTPGGGVQQKSEEQPHAITDARELSMGRQDTKRGALPVALDAERPLPDARR